MLEKIKQCYFREKHIVINDIEKTLAVYRLTEKWVEKLRKVKDLFVLFVEYWISYA